MKLNTIKLGAACALIYWATACFYIPKAVAQATRESVAASFYASPPFATGGKTTAPIPEPALLNAGNPLVKQGQYLARAGDCIGCHSRPGGAPFAGGLALQTPFGVIVSTNITPNKTGGIGQGIGNYTQAQFNQLMREGINAAGHNIYPAMPYASYARLSDADLAALYAYFTLGLASVVQVNAETNLPWPFSMRWLVKAWNWLYLPKPGYTADVAHDPQWNRGAYLVQSLGHCGACHTPRNLAGAEKANNEKGATFLAGAVIDGWYAQSLRNGAESGGGLSGLTRWTQKDLVDYLSSGRNAHTAAFGAMAEVVGNSTQHMSPSDLTAIATYLKSLGDDATTGVAANERVAPTPPTISPTALALRSGEATLPGAMVYLNNCAGCHQSSAKGASLAFPSLAQSSTVAADNPTSLIRIVLQGANMPGTAGAPSRLAMPGYDWRLSDANVADVLTFVRSNWGNRATAVSTAEVAKVRKALAVKP